MRAECKLLLDHTSLGREHAWWITDIPHRHRPHLRSARRSPALQATADTLRLEYAQFLKLEMFTRFARRH
jgi:hypothetical protein